MAAVDLDLALAFAIQLAKDVGKMIKDGQAKRFASNAGIGHKVNSVDVVTEVDKAVEEYVKVQILKTFPDHRIIGEETYAGEAISDEPTWIVDPIDGTLNFVGSQEQFRAYMLKIQVHGLPIVTTSIGLTVSGVPVVGVIYNPFLDLLYSAAMGKGAYLNGETRLPITGTPRPLNGLGEALISTEYGAQRSAPAYQAKCQSWNNLTRSKDEGGKMVHSVRCLGSTAFNLCQIAAGGVDIHWSQGWPWDVCAGMCIVTEAGGVVFGGKNQPLTGVIDKALVAGRKYLVMRAVPAAEDKSALEIQKALAADFYSAVVDYDF